MKITINGKEVIDITEKPAKTKFDTFITVSGIVSMVSLLIGSVLHDYFHLLSMNAYMGLSLASVCIGMVSILGVAIKALTHIFKREK